MRRIAKSSGEHLGISCNFDAFVLGESIAVNGVCLTVTAFSEGYFECDASSETLQRTNLGSLPHGASVNLERALRIGDRLGGHIVSGHVDGTGYVKSVNPSGESLAITFSAPANVLRLVVEKGSIAIDGASLTVNRVTDADFEIMLIPHSQSMLSENFWQVGRCVNLETDILGKYVEKLLSCTNNERSGISKPASSITMETLRETGFLGF